MSRFFDIKNPEASLLATYNEEHDTEVAQQHAYEAAVEAKLAAEKAAAARAAEEAEAKRSAARAAVKHALAERVAASELTEAALKPTLLAVTNCIHPDNIGKNPTAAYINDPAFMEAYQQTSKLAVVPMELTGTDVIDHLMQKFKDVIELAQFHLRSANHVIDTGRAKEQSFYTENNLLSPEQAKQFYGGLLEKFNTVLPDAAILLLKDAYNCRIDAEVVATPAAAPAPRM